MIRKRTIHLITKQTSKSNIHQDKYIINKEPLSYDYSSYTTFGKASNVLSYLRKNFGTNHIEENHPE
ncbi:MAG: hypothetical protein K2K15_01490, partial [Anaeroplasmataceae bacterium]|nr:hypothetical protein [Anaeroplasmataceae bacterium]